jgi:hypothetical protein
MNNMTTVTPTATTNTIPDTHPASSPSRPGCKGGRGGSWSSSIFSIVTARRYNGPIVGNADKEKGRQGDKESFQAIF